MIFQENKSRYWLLGLQVFSVLPCENVFVVLILSVFRQMNKNNNNKK